VGLGACGVTSTDDDDIVSISHFTFDAASNSGNPNQNPLCGRKIRAQKEKDGKTVSVDVTVVDRCAYCSSKYEHIRMLMRQQVPVVNPLTSTSALLYSRSLRILIWAEFLLRGRGFNQFLPPYYKVVTFYRLCRVIGHLADIPKKLVINVVVSLYCRKIIQP
jgi:hypothetical protein